MWIIAKYIKYIVVFAALWTFMGTYRTVSCHKMYNDQMSPTIKVDEFKKVAVGKRDPDDIVAGESIVIYEWETGGPMRQKQESPYYCGRVIAKPGQRIKMEYGKVIVDGKAIGEAYVMAESFSGLETLDEIVVPLGHYWIMGDNRKLSRGIDSRTFGPIPIDAVVGIVSQ